MHHLPKHWCVSGGYHCVAESRNISHVDFADDGGVPGEQRYGACSARRRQQKKRKKGSAAVPLESFVPVPQGKPWNAVEEEVKTRATLGEHAKNLGGGKYNPGLGEEEGVPKTLATVVQNLRAAEEGREPIGGEPEPAAGDERGKGVLQGSGSAVGGAVKRSVGQMGENGGPGPRDIKSSFRALSKAAPS